MKKKPDVSGLFHAVASVRGPDNIQSFSIVTIRVKDGVVVDVAQSQPDVPAITFHRADRAMRENAAKLDEVISAKA